MTVSIHHTKIECTYCGKQEHIVMEQNKPVCSRCHAGFLMKA